MTSTVCQECTILLKKIDEAASSVHRLSTEALRVSREQQLVTAGHVREFEELQHLHQLGMLRAQTLRECLGVHMDVQHSH